MTQSVKIKIKGGLKANLPALDDRELAVATDTNELFCGSQRLNIMPAIVGSVEDISELPENGRPDEMYLVNGVLYRWRN